MADYGLEQPLFDEDPELAAFNPLTRQQALASAVRRSPALTMPSSGVATPRPRSSMSPGTAEQTLAEINARIGQRPDIAPLLAQARAREEESNRNLMTGVALSMKGGEGLQPLGGHFLQQALKQQGGYEIPGGWGTVTKEGVTWNPEKQDQADLDRLTRLYAIQAKAEQGKPDRLQRAGMTPSGELVSFNPTTGEQLVNGRPYTGQVMSQGEIDKRTASVMEAQSGAQRAQTLLAKVKAYPRAFGGIAALSNYTGPYASARIVEKNLSPEERAVRMQVLQDAAMVIHDLYGSALTAGEETRANTFAIKPTDPPEIVMDKLQTAMSWANNHANQYGRLVRGAANARSGGGPAPAQTTPSAAPGGQGWGIVR